MMILHKKRSKQKELQNYSPKRINRSFRAGEQSFLALAFAGNICMKKHFVRELQGLSRGTFWMGVCMFISLNRRIRIVAQTRYRQKVGNIRMVNSTTTDKQTTTPFQENKLHARTAAMDSQALKGQLFSRVLDNTRVLTNLRGTRALTHSLRFKSN